MHVRTGLSNEKGPSDVFSAFYNATRRLFMHEKVMNGHFGLSFKCICTFQALIYVHMYISGSHLCAYVHSFYICSHRFNGCTRLGLHFITLVKLTLHTYVLFPTLKFSCCVECRMKLSFKSRSMFGK
jgi:hypothetical protein